MTLHKYKGLEFDVVLHLDLYEWILQMKKPGINNDWNNPNYSDLLQDIDLNYVGITRVKKACFLISSSLRTNTQERKVAANESEFLSYKYLWPLRHNKNVYGK